MKKGTFNVLFLIFLMVNLYSCIEKDDPEPTLKDILTAKTWELNKINLISSRINWLVPDELRDQYKTLQITFQPDGTYTKIVSGVISSGTWGCMDKMGMMKNEFYMILDAGTVNETFWLFYEFEEGTCKISTQKTLDSNYEIFIWMEMTQVQ